MTDEAPVGYYEWLNFNNPMTEETADRLIAELAQRNAIERGLASRVTFSSTLGAEPAADLVINLGAEHVFGNLEAALVGLWPLVRPGGRLLLGTQFWEQTPTQELIEAIGHVPSLPELIDGATAAGWRPLGLRVATLGDWDHFEFRFLGDWEQFVMAPTTATQAASARLAADEHRAGYLRRRGVLGFAFLTLGRPLEPSSGRG